MRYAVQVYLKNGTAITFERELDSVEDFCEKFFSIKVYMQSAGNQHTCIRTDEVLFVNISEWVAPVPVVQAIPEDAAVPVPEAAAVASEAPPVVNEVAKEAV